MTPTPAPAPGASTDPVLHAQQDAARAARRVQPVRIVHRGVRMRWAVLVGLLLGGAGAAGSHYGAPWLRPGVVLVTSEPHGLDVTLDGQRTGQVTPRGAGERPPVAAARRRGLAARRRRRSPRRSRACRAGSSRRFTSRSGRRSARSRSRACPPGAEIVLDDRPTGRTPVTLGDVRLDQRHRIDLVLTGHEIDQFVVLPEKDGVRFTRRLARLEPKAKAPQAPSP